VHRFIQQFDDDDRPLPLNIPPGDRRHIVAYHDECCFHANDQSNICWVTNDEQPLRQKSRGRLIHVSDWVCADSPTGRLAIKDKKNGGFVSDARKIIHPGKQGDPYWDSDQLNTQVAEMIPIFEQIFPGCRGVFIFDQSSAHAAFAKDALNVKNMNVGIGGSQTKMHDTVIPDDNPHPHLRGKPQSMVIGPDHELFSVYPHAAKGMQLVLKERGLLDKIAKGRNKKALGTSQKCKTSKEKQEKARKMMEESPELYGSIGKTIQLLNVGHLS
jgi:hypothetical protein